MEIFSALALVGAVWLVRRRSWVPIVGLTGLGPGVAAFLLVLAGRGTYVSPRYFAAIDIALLLGAGVGLGAIAIWARDPLRRRVGVRWLVPLTIAAAVMAAGGASWPIPSLDASFRSSARAPRLQAERDARVVPVLACALDAIPDARTFPPEAETNLLDSTLSSTVVLVAGLERPRLSVELGVPLDKISGTPPGVVEPGPDYLPYGRLVFHDRRASRADSAYTSLEVSEPTADSSTTLVPLLADDAAGIWVLRIDRTDGDSGGPACDEIGGS
jgi:hypothetical protein